MRRHPLPLCRCYLEEVERELLRGLDQMMRAETWQPLTSELKVRGRGCAAHGPLLTGPV